MKVVLKALKHFWLQNILAKSTPSNEGVDALGRDLSCECSFTTGAIKASVQLIKLREGFGENNC